MKTKILYEDSEVLVIHKPAGLATQSGKVGQADVVSELKNYLAKNKASSTQENHNKGAKDNIYLGVVHRLDQPVEGLLVFAKTPKAASNLTGQLQKSTLNKKYYALCLWNKVSAEDANGIEIEGDLVDYLCKDGMLGKVVPREYKDAKEARLHYKRMDTSFLEKEKLAEVGVLQEELILFDVSIETGRFHQIRVQMSHAGFPLLGDSKYGTEESLLISQKLRIRNVCLYAYQVAFKHPNTGKYMEFNIEQDITNIIALLRK